MPYNKKTQRVVRTYPCGWSRAAVDLEEVLEEGWMVKHITAVREGVNEYIVEKELKELKNEK